MSVKSGNSGEWKNQLEPKQEYKPVTLKENIYCPTKVMCQEQLNTET